MKEAYYKPSGKFSVSFFLYFILFQALAIPLLSVIYIYLIYYIPIAYLNFLITMGCGIAAGLVMNRIIHSGKVRNSTIALFFGILAVCVMKYVQWCVYIPLVFTNAYEMYTLTLPEQFEMTFELLLRPSVVVEYIGFINQVGVWSIATTTFNGILLIIVWLLEFLIMAGSACIILLDKSKSPFCEEEGAWYVEIPKKIRAGIPENFESLKKDMERGDFNELIRLTRDYPANASQCLFLVLYKARNSERYYMNVKKLTVTIEKGKQKTKEETLIKYITIDANSVSEIQGVV